MIRSHPWKTLQLSLEPDEISRVVKPGKWSYCWICFQRTMMNVKDTRRLTDGQAVINAGLHRCGKN